MPPQRCNQRAEVSPQCLLQRRRNQVPLRQPQTAWLREIAAEATAAIEAGVLLEDVCLYPVLDRPDCDDSDRWHNSGLFDRGSFAGDCWVRRAG